MHTIIDKQEFYTKIFSYLYSVLEVLPFDNKEYYSLINRYKEPHRYYHNENHLIDCLQKSIELDTAYDRVLNILVSIYHDAVYNPVRDDNEERSAELYDFSCVIDKKIIDKELVRNLILNTKSHKEINTFNKIDMSILRTDNVLELLEYENNIFKEYQFVNLKTYIDKRIEFLSNDEWITNKNRDILIDYITNRKYNIGIYCGSFNPFHVGHYNILKQAEKYFDKVIIAIGYNFNRYETLKNLTLPYNEVIQYFSLTSELCADYTLNAKNIEVTLIRGIRNNSDLQAEQNIRPVLKDKDDDFKTVYFLCDSKYQHVSSSMIRELREYNSDVDKYINFI